MLKRLLTAVVVAMLWACVSSAQTYNYVWQTGDANRDGGGGHTLSLTVPSNVSQFTISAEFASTFTYSLTSGSALILGEWVHIQINNFPVDDGIFKIVDLGIDGNGHTTFTVNRTLTFASTAPGSGNAGPGFEFLLYFDTLNSTASCDSTQSSATAWFLDSNGAMQSVASSSVTCSNTPADGGRGFITTGTFSGIATNGQQVNVSFTINTEQGRYGLYATSAQWIIQ